MNIPGLFPDQYKNTPGVSKQDQFNHWALNALFSHEQDMKIRRQRSERIDRAIEKLKQDSEKIGHDIEELKQDFEKNGQDIEKLEQAIEKLEQDFEITRIQKERKRLKKNNRPLLSRVWKVLKWKLPYIIIIGVIAFLAIGIAVPLVSSLVG